MGRISDSGHMPNFNNNNNDNNNNVNKKKETSGFNSAKKSHQLNKWDFIVCSFATLGSAYALYQTNSLPLKLAGLACLSGIAIKVVQLPMINKIIKMSALGSKVTQLSSDYWRRGMVLTMISSALVGLAALKFIPNQTMLSQELVGGLVGLVAVQTILELGIYLYQLRKQRKAY